MKKIILLLLVMGAVYTLKPELFSPTNKKGAFDEQGNPLTLIFTHNKCGKYCDDAISILKKRRIDFAEYKLDGDDVNQAMWKEYGGVNSFPNVIVGDHRFYGSNKSGIVSVLALNYGDSILTSAERYYMKKHFNDDGSPKLVLYGTDWCGYCKKLRAALNENNIAYLDIDVEKSSQRQAMTAALDIDGFPLVYYGYKRMSGPRPADVLAIF